MIIFYNLKEVWTKYENYFFWVWSNERLSLAADKINSNIEIISEIEPSQNPNNQTK